MSSHGCADIMPMAVMSVKLQLLPGYRVVGGPRRLAWPRHDPRLFNSYAALLGACALSSRPRSTGAFCRCFLHHNLPLQMTLVVTVRMLSQRISLYVGFFKLSGTYLTGCTPKKHSCIGVKHSRQYACLGPQLDPFYYN